MGSLHHGADAWNSFAMLIVITPIVGMAVHLDACILIEEDKRELHKRLCRLSYFNCILLNLPLHTERAAYGRS